MTVQKAYSYVRFSTPEQKKGTSLERQVEGARNYCARNGLELDESLNLSDEGLSAFTGSNLRKGSLGRFMRLVDDGEIEPGSVLIVENLDRITREDALKAQGLFIDIISSGVEVHTLQDGKTYSKESVSDNPSDLIMSLLLMIRAHEESLTKSRRGSDVWARKRNKASEKPLTSRVPAWLELDKDSGKIKVIPERRKVIKKIFKWTLEGIGQQSIARKLNEAGEPPWGQSKGWGRSYIKKILENEAVIGTYIPHTYEHVDGRRVRRPQEPIEGYYPAVVDEDAFSKVAALRTTRRPPTGAGKTIQNPLATLVRCPLCGGAMTTNNKGKNLRYLVCRIAKEGAGCSYHAEPLKPILEALQRDVDGFIRTIPSPDGSLDDEEVALSEAMDRLEERRERLLDTIEQTGSKEAKDRLRKLEGELEGLQGRWRDLQERIQAASGVSRKRRIEELREQLKADPIDPGQLNVALKMLVREVVVDYKNGDLEIEWLAGGFSTLTYDPRKDFENVGG